MDSKIYHGLRTNLDRMCDDVVSGSDSLSGITQRESKGLYESIKKPILSTAAGLMLLYSTAGCGFVRPYTPDLVGRPKLVMEEDGRLHMGGKPKEEKEDSDLWKYVAGGGVVAVVSAIVWAIGESMGAWDHTDSFGPGGHDRPRVTNREGKGGPGGTN